MGTEDQIHKGDSKYQKAKIKKLEQRLDSQKYRTKSITKIYLYIYIWNLFLKHRFVFFLKGNRMSPTIIL